MTKKQKKDAPKRLFMVMKLLSKIQTNTGIPVTLQDQGVVGMVPVFDSYEKAVDWMDGDTTSAQIFECKFSS